MTNDEKENEFTIIINDNSPEDTLSLFKKAIVEIILHQENKVA